MQKKKQKNKVKPPTYQPSVKELNEKIDMPGADMKYLRRAFFGPTKGVLGKAKKYD